MPGVAVDLQTAAPPSAPRERPVRKPDLERGKREYQRE
jgi:hypothetical protein